MSKNPKATKTSSDTDPLTLASITDSLSLEETPPLIPGRAPDVPLGTRRDVVAKHGTEPIPGPPAARGVEDIIDPEAEAEAWRKRASEIDKDLVGEKNIVQFESIGSYNKEAFQKVLREDVYFGPIYLYHLLRDSGVGNDEARTKLMEIIIEQRKVSRVFRPTPKPKRDMLTREDVNKIV